jgi:MFS family permease
MGVFRTVAALVAAQTILQLAGGLFGVWLPLVMHARGFSPSGIGLVAAAYSIGFMAGAWFSPAVLARLGHIRAFAGAAAICCVTALALYPSDHPALWALNRMIFGAVLAVMFAAAESWMAGVTPKERRGDVLGFYLLCTKVALAGGPFLIAGAAGGDDAWPFMLAAGLFALSLTPVAATSQAQPQPPQSAPIALARMWDLAPAACVSAFMAGVINAGVMSLSPIWAQDRAGADAAAGFQAAAWIGSLFVQWGAGRLSDTMDRRLVIAALAGGSSLAALALALAPQSLPFFWASVLFGLWGAGSLSFYGLAVAHMADRSEPGEMAGATAGLLFLWAIGSVIGPAVSGFLMEHVFGPNALFGVAAGSGLALALYLLVRRAGRPAVQREDKSVFRPAQTTSTAQGALLPEKADAAERAGPQEIRN